MLVVEPQDLGRTGDEYNTGEAPQSLSQIKGLSANLPRLQFLLLVY